ncbi:hypothetical protein SCORR_v1c06420 [Spiroplasma corruscae]|uniref:Lipoprotein n=1 Tax=Spiroplasma corruscae TaxID=216934 RepID=A0A222EQ56_9MOLU|nr:hypothetical protein [Spiroplasma corruscae]ASP28414.1 hypothetical protein SCORR_v1c06420 [Spiroplasma corruscae]
MKKILTILTSFNLIAVSGGLTLSVISCDDKTNDVNQLNYVEGKNDSDLISLLKDSEKIIIASESGTLNVNKNNKLGEEYIIPSESFNEFILFWKLDIEGVLFISNFDTGENYLSDDFKALFTELKDLNGTEIVDLNEEEKVYTYYFTSIFGYKGDTSFDINITKVISKVTIINEKSSVLSDCSKIYSKTINI